MDSFKKWLEERGVKGRAVEMMERAKDRELRNSMITKVYR